MVGDVVAVQTVRVRLKIRRCINVADSQRVEVRDNLPCLRKSEPAIELQSVGAGWDPCHVERSRDISHVPLRWLGQTVRIFGDFSTPLRPTKRCYIFSGILMPN